VIDDASMTKTILAAVLLLAITTPTRAQYTPNTPEGDACLKRVASEYDLYVATKAGTSEDVKASAARSSPFSWEMYRKMTIALIASERCFGGK
jgi:hypothetical protein